MERHAIPVDITPIKLPWPNTRLASAAVSDGPAPKCELASWTRRIKDAVSFEHVELTLENESVSVYPEERWLCKARENIVLSGNDKSDV
jgi:hypothetical protein